MAPQLSPETTTWYWQQFGIVPPCVGAGADAWQDTADEEVVADVEDGGEAGDIVVLMNWEPVAETLESELRTIANQKSFM